MIGSAIPIDALEAAHWLVVGTTGSGKTYLARGLFEQLRQAGRRLGAIDKLGKLWGLTVSADGAGAGLEFVIFGGKRPGAVPMRPGDGERIGALFVERNIPAIFDVSQWDAEEQEAWVSAFCRAVFASNEAALHLLVDEAQSWVPANGGGYAYKAVKLLAEQGRGNGINLLLTAPRLNGIDVAVRQALGGMVAMRQTSARDRTAVAELVGGHLSIDEKAFREGLPSLPTGTGYVWSPTGAGLEKVEFPANATFDSSRTPRHGDAPPPPIAVSSALVDELRAALAPPAPAPTADCKVDPADTIVRDSRIAALEQRLAEADAARLLAVDLGREAHLALLELGREAIARAERINGRLLAALGVPSADLPGIANSLSPSRTDDRSLPWVGGEAGEAGGEDDAAPPASTDQDAAASALRGRRALQALVAHPNLTEQQWAWVSGLERKGGTWSTYKGALRAAGLVEERGGLWRATDQGLSAAAMTGAPITGPGAQLAGEWAKRISGATKLVDVLLKRWPHMISREALAADTNLAAGGGTFGEYVSRLRRRGLIEERGRKLRLNPDLMGVQHS